MKNSINRRSFLRSAAVIPAGLAIRNVPVFGEEAPPLTPVKPTEMPMITLGGQKISRLISGSNTVNGGSHLSHLVNRSMNEYFSVKAREYFARCLEAGINTFQGSNTKNYEEWNGNNKPGKTQHFISLAKMEDDNYTPTLEYAVKNKFLALAFHGEVTDRMFKKGELDRIEDYLKKIRDSGIQVGISTHMPDVIDYVESKGWDIDFYMACVYERHRSAEDLKKMLGYVPVPVGEVYLEEDPPRMYKMIQQTDRTCLAFKILAAGRLCDRKNLLEKAFKDAFAGIKSKDAVIVGMFPKWTDHIAMNAELVRKYGGSAI